MTLPKQIQKELDKAHVNAWARLPVWTKGAIYAAVVLFLTIITIAKLTNAFSDIKRNFGWGKENNVPHAEISKDTTSDLKGNNPKTPTSSAASVLGISTNKIITNFTDWKNYEKFDSHTDNSQILYPTFSSFFPEGRTMYSPFMLGPKLKATFAFRPLSKNRANVLFTLKDILQCIIGNGNYKHLDCETPPYNKGYLTEQIQQQVHAWIDRPFGIKEMTTQFLTISAEPKEDSELLTIKLTLKFIPFVSKDGQYKTEDFEYRVPIGKPSESVSYQIGLGIIDPEKYRQHQDDKAGFELISLEIDP